MNDTFNEIPAAQAELEEMIEMMASDHMAPGEVGTFGTKFVAVCKRCPKCHQLHGVAVFKQDYIDWAEGGLIQNCFPYLTANQRELVKTGICEECWERIFGPEE